MTYIVRFFTKYSKPKPYAEAKHLYDVMVKTYGNDNVELIKEK